MFSHKKIYAAGFIGFCHKSLTLFSLPLSHRAAMLVLNFYNIYCELKKTT